jgi:hypothetical protein
VVNLPSRDHDYADPDHWRLPYDSPKIPYSWSRAEGSPRTDTPRD